MRHFANPAFWKTYQKLPENIRNLADKNYALLKENPQHPSLHLRSAASYTFLQGAYDPIGRVNDEAATAFDTVVRRIEPFTAHYPA